MHGLEGEAVSRYRFRDAKHQTYCDPAQNTHPHTPVHTTHGLGYPRSAAFNAVRRNTCAE
jgi:hypothetical protein